MYLIHRHLLEARLQYLEVLYVLVLQIGTKFDTLYGH